MTDFYDKALEKFANGEINLSEDDIKPVLLDVADYAWDKATDEFLADIPSAARVAIGPNLTGKTTTAGVFDATSPYAFSAVTGDPCEAVAYFKDTGDPATSPLLSYHDSAVSGLPVTPNGGDINIIFDWIFKL
ncbi:hypothetical protein HMPREF0591_4797 [Mycobacterium parascrofulaceum ATCC BAA-614]|uniref:Uncharacterized protein n=1 Tax=Mycobacterium parascrofulaceum ATCC BAA-614 TaxID=525368 RepID=D5PF53_9MYCO|nr:hypothetical protein [Mycobacterium parascrofulaceum]EFG75297.1 hypothetical protein HMPREF0591_4797 [Mycobacterium parascrofulaceum ATCC BAA-614]